MKVLFIARRFPPSVGGMERFAFDLSNSLNKKIKLIKITWGGSNKWLPLVLPIFFLRAAWQLLLHRDIKVIHMQDAVQAPIGWLLRAIFKKPYIVVAHGLDITYSPGFYQKVIIPFVRKADAVVSISSATNGEVIARGVDPKKAMVISLGTHDDYGDPNPNKQLLSKKVGIDVTSKKLLLTTGRLVERKGVAWFIENALPSIVAGDDNVLYLVAGDGEERGRIEQATQRANMDNHVELLGRVTDEVRSLLYQSCDIFVMPNVKVLGDMEGFGIVVHEAAVAKLPVVASGIEGILDALHDGKNGVLVESGNADEFVKEIQKLLTNENQRELFGEKARKFTLDNFSWKKIGELYVECYMKLNR